MPDIKHSLTMIKKNVIIGDYIYYIIVFIYSNIVVKMCLKVIF